MTKEKSIAEQMGLELPRGVLGRKERPKLPSHWGVCIIKVNNLSTGQATCDYGMPPNAHLRRM